MAKMKLKFKFDFTRVKEFLLAKGERVGLLTCGVIAILLIGVGFWGASGFGKPEKGKGGKEYPSYKAALDEGTKSLKAAIDRAKGGEGDGGEAVIDAGTGILPGFDWVDRRPSFNPVQFFATTDQLDTKRREPRILTIYDERWRIDYVLGGYFHYNVSTRDEKVEVFKAEAVKGGPAVPVGAEPTPVKHFKPVRMAMISAVFPMKKQIEAYRMALRFRTIDELVQSKLLPKPAFVNVFRYERKPDGKWDPSRSDKLYQIDEKTGKPTVLKNTMETLRYSFWDTLEPRMYDKSINLSGGLVTPVPRFANTEVPAIVLDGINVDESIRKKGLASAGTYGPVMVAGGGRLPGVEPKGDKDKPLAEARDAHFQPWAQLISVKERLQGNFEIFPTYSALIGDAEIPGKPPVGGVKMPPEAVGGAVGDPLEYPEDVLVRFIDADMSPGKTYAYEVQIVMHNPNFGAEKKDVAFEDLTKKKYLFSPKKMIMKEAQVTSEFHLYAVDEAPAKDITGGADTVKKVPVLPNHAAMQIQRWIEHDSIDGKNFYFGDWAIAERLVVRKGEFIGRSNVKVELAEWEPRYIGFRINALAVKDDKKGKKTAKDPVGIPIDFQGDFSRGRVDPRRYALVDIDGGKRDYKAPPGGTSITGEETVVNLLILNPDGRLEVRNSRTDTADAERIKRRVQWRKRIDETLKNMGVSDGGVGGGGLPGAGG